MMKSLGEILLETVKRKCIVEQHEAANAYCAAEYYRISELPCRAAEWQQEGAKRYQLAWKQLEKLLTVQRPEKPEYTITYIGRDGFRQETRHCDERAAAAYYTAACNDGVFKYVELKDGKGVIMTFGEYTAAEVQ